MPNLANASIILRGISKFQIFWSELDQTLFRSSEYNWFFFKKYSFAYIYLGHLLNERHVWKSLACAQEGPQTAIGGLDQLKDSKFEDEDSDEEEHFVDADKQDKEETRKKSVSDQEKSKGKITNIFAFFKELS